jgi:hypothetical protein
LTQDSTLEIAKNHDVPRQKRGKDHAPVATQSRIIPGLTANLFAASP